MNDPFIISSIILAIAFLFILICNYKLKSKIIKFSFLILSIIFLILIFIFDNSFIYEFLKSLITYIWYPSYVLFVVTIIFSIIILIWTLLYNKLLIINKTINYLFFCICFCCYIIFLRLNIDPLLYNSLYSSKSLIIMRTVSISFIVCIFVNIVFKLRGRYEN